MGVATAAAVRLLLRGTMAVESPRQLGQLGEVAAAHAAAGWQQQQALGTVPQLTRSLEEQTRAGELAAGCDLHLWRRPFRRDVVRMQGS